MLLPLLGTLIALTGKISHQSTGEPVVNAVIALHQNEEEIASAETDSRGIFELSSLDPGDYAVEIQARLFQPLALAITLLPDQHAILDASLEPKPGSLAGTVIDELSQELIGGAIVIIESAENHEQIALCVTEKEGCFEVATLPPGKYGIRASALNYKGSTTGVKIKPTKSHTSQLQLTPKS